MTEIEQPTANQVEDTRTEPSFVPDVDIVETSAAIIVHADLPGVAEDGVDVHLDDGVLSLVGRIESEDDENLSPVHTEYNPGNFRRQFTISSEVDSEKIEGQISDGVLRLILPKRTGAQPRQIPISSG